MPGIPRATAGGNIPGNLPACTESEWSRREMGVRPVKVGEKAVVSGREKRGCQGCCLVPRIDFLMAFKFFDKGGGLRVGLRVEGTGDELRVTRGEGEEVLSAES